MQSTIASGKTAAAKRASKLGSSRSIKSQKAKLTRFLASVKAENIFPTKNKRAAENLKKVGLVKSRG